ncbi:hypothetical protein N9Y68_05305 [Luminiphilus sp.]|nr:hypothetical protein [Luminiphilus sp.]
MEKNPVVAQAASADVPIYIFNKRSEIPNEILSLNNIYLKDGFDTDRPQLGDIIREINENVLICNSDIFFNYEFKSKLNFYAAENSEFSFSGRRYDIYSEFSYQLGLSEATLKETGFLQSDRTLDFFFLKYEHLSLLTPIFSISPGTVGFDIVLSAHLNKNSVLADGSDFFPVFHRNHEIFKEIFYSSFILDIEQRQRFVDDRFSMSLASGFEYAQGGLIFCSAKISKYGFVTRRTGWFAVGAFYEKFLIKMSNSIELGLFFLNKLIADAFRFELRCVVLSRRLKISLFFPNPMVRDSRSFKERVSSYCQRERLKFR